MASVWLTRDECEYDEDLPPVCCVCGQPAEHVRRQKFSWHPPWVAVFILVAVLIYIIVAVVLTKRMTARMPVCDRHTGYWRTFRLVAWGSILGSLAVAIGGLTLLAQNRPGQPGGIGGYVAAAGGVGFLVCLIGVAIWQATRVRPQEITDDDMKLGGVSREFADAVKADRRQRREARAERRRLKEAEEPAERPRRRRYEEED